MKHSILAAAFGAMLCTPAIADEAFTYAFDGSFDDATFAVESAIVGQGLVIDYVSHVGEMLNRTGADVGSDTMMEADPMNITYCPYGIFVMETDDGVTVGHKDYPEGSMQAVEDLMQQIVAEAVGN